jgi:hypothetical protein
MTLKSAKEFPEQKSEFYFVRKNKNGEAVFRRDTNESVEHVAAVLNKNGIPFQYKEKGYCFVLYRADTRRYYQYFHTTGRWGMYRQGGIRPEKHYHSKGIQDFLDRFFSKLPDWWQQKEKEEEQKTELKGSDYVEERDYERLKTKYERVFAFMQKSGWAGLKQIAEATKTPESTASAILRSFRRKENGGHTVERRYVVGGLYVYKLIENKDDSLS